MTNDTSQISDLRSQIGLTLIELLLSIMLMGLLSVILSQTFSVATDAYHRGRRAVRGIGETRNTCRAIGEAARSMRPDTATLTLNFGPAGSHINFVRLARSGIEENGFNTSTEKGKLTLWFRREWPVDGGAAEGGARFPLIRDIGGFEISLISPADRKISRWPVSGSQSDTPPRLLEFKIQRRDGQVFESAAWIRTDIEAFAVASDT